MAERCREAIVRQHDQLALRIEAISSDTRACTAALTDEIAGIARHREARVERERAIECFRQSVRNGKPVKKQGRLDLYAVFPDGSRLAIEIDRSYKNWSVRKLRHAKTDGAIELWIRWNGDYTWLSDIETLNVNFSQRTWRSDAGLRRPD